MSALPVSRYDKWALDGPKEDHVRVSNFEFLF